MTKPKLGGARKGAGRKAKDGVETKRVNVTLDRFTLQSLRKIGKGNLSLGIRIAALFHNFE